MRAPHDDGFTAHRVMDDAAASLNRVEGIGSIARCMADAEDHSVFGEPFVHVFRDDTERLTRSNPGTSEIVTCAVTVARIAVLLQSLRPKQHLSTRVAVRPSSQRRGVTRVTRQPRSFERSVDRHSLTVTPDAVRLLISDEERHLPNTGHLEAKDPSIHRRVIGDGGAAALAMDHRQGGAFKRVVHDMKVVHDPQRVGARDAVEVNDESDVEFPVVDCVSRRLEGRCRE